MKYLYYFIWVGIATFYKYFSGFLFKLRKFIWKVRKTNKDEQQRWIKDYNSGFFSFPGGIVDWFAFGFLLAGIIASIIILLICFDLESGFFNSKWKLYTLFIGLGVFCYYWIYSRKIDWLKGRINKINKKYYIK